MTEQPAAGQPDDRDEPTHPLAGPADDSVADPAADPVDGPVDRPVNAPGTEPLGSPTDTPTDSATDSPATEPFHRAADEPTTEPATEPTDGPVHGAADKPATEPIDGPAHGPTDGAATEPVRGAVDEPATERVPPVTMPLPPEGATYPPPGSAGFTPGGAPGGAPGGMPGGAPGSGPGTAGFPPPGGFPPPPPGTGGWASRYGLVRPTQGRILAGVCAAVGRATNTDPVLWRVLFAVLTLVGGVGLLAYVIGWLLIPGEGDSGSPVEALFGRGKSSTSPILVIIIGVLAVVGLGTFFYHGLRSAALLLAVILGAIILISRGGNGLPVPPPVAPGAPPMPPPPAPPAPTMAYAGPAPTMPPTIPPTVPPTMGPTVPIPTPPTMPAPPPVPPTQGYRPPFAPHGPYASRYPYPGLTAPPPPPPPKPRRPPSKLGRIVFSVTLLLLGALAVIDVAGGADVPGIAYVALALGAIAVGLIIGAWFGRARWLIPIGVVLMLALGVATAIARIDPHPGRAGDITWVPGTVADISDRYDASFGDATLDLTEVDFTGAQKDVAVTISAGSLTVLLPPKVDTEVVARVAVGNAHVFDSHWSGIGSPQREITDNGTDGPGGGKLTLTVRVNAGDLEVRR